MRAFWKNRHVQVFAFNFVAAVAVPVIVELSLQDKISPLEDIVLGFGIFAVLSFAQILYFVRALEEARETRENIWRATTNFDGVLSKLRESFSIIVHATHSAHDRLYEDLIMDDANRFGLELERAAHDKRIPVKDHNFKSHDMIREIFKDTSTNIYRELFILNKRSGDFDHIYADFFRMIADMVAAGEIEVRTLFVRTPEEDFVKTPGIQKLLNFYEDNNDYSKKVIDEQQLALIKKQYQVGDPAWVDFGIYGDHLIFQTLDYVLDGPTTGEFCKDPKVVREFLRFFDKAWDGAQDLAPIERKSLEITEVFESPS